MQYEFFLELIHARWIQTLYLSIQADFLGLPWLFQMPLTKYDHAMAKLLVDIETLFDYFWGPKIPSTSSSKLWSTDWLELLPTGRLDGRWHTDPDQTDSSENRTFSGSTFQLQPLSYCSPKWTCKTTIRKKVYFYLE